MGEATPEEAEPGRTVSLRFSPRSQHAMGTRRPSEFPDYKDMKRQRR